MERMSIENQQGVLYKEHIQRYQFIKPLLNGKVLDIACGVGYGSKVLKDTIDQYLGIDFSKEAIKDAKKYYKIKNKVDFLQGDILDINIAENTFDNVISFETLEHLHEPEKAISEVCRVLKNDGIFIGSVPSQDYDDLCEKIYGKNPYHITRFEIQKLKKLLYKQFEFIELYVNELMICNSFKNYSNEPKKNTNSIVDNLENNIIYGSIIFIASNDKDKISALRNKINNRIYSLMGLVEYDAIKEMPLRKTISDQEKLIQERDRYIQELLDERQQIIDNYEHRMAEAIAAIKSQDKLVEERDRYIKELERKING